MAVPVENITVLPPEPKRRSSTQPLPEKSFADVLQEEDKSHGDETDSVTDPWEELSAHLSEPKEPLPDLPHFEVPMDTDIATGYSPIGRSTGSAGTTSIRGRIVDLSV